MGHRLYMRADGSYAFASTESEWHSLGHLASQPLTAAEALTATGMDTLHFTQHPVFASTDSGFVEMPRSKAVMLNERLDNTGMSRRKPVAVTGRDREVFPFEELIQPLDMLVDQSGGSIETIGLFDDGATWFATVKMPEGVTIGGDQHNIYAFGRDSIVGAYDIVPNTFRVLCGNTFDAAVHATAGTKTRYRLQHRRGARPVLQEIRDAIALTYDNAKEFAELGENLLSFPLTVEAFFGITDELFGKPVPDALTSRSQTIYDNRRGMLNKLFLHSETTETTFRNGEPTKWTGFQAIGEYLDHFSSVRGLEQVRRAERLISGSFNPVKAKAIDLILAA